MPQKSARSDERHQPTQPRTPQAHATVAPPRRRVLTIALASLCTAVVMMAFHAAKDAWFQAITLWQSHLATTAFVSVVAGIVTYLMAMGLDRVLAERKQAEEVLQQREVEFGGLIERAGLGFFRSTPQGRFLAVNPALIRMLRYGSAEDMLQLDLGRDVYANPGQRAALIEELERTGISKGEVQWRRRDGSLVTLRLIGRVVEGPSATARTFEALVEDVTEQRSLEAQFRQAQRLEAVGRLAGGVAHDFNNVLTAITGYSDLLLDDLGPKDRKRADVEEIRAATLRAAALTRQLLALSRRQVVETRVLDLNATVEMLEKMLRRLIGEDVKLVFTPGPELGAVRADPGQIEQIVLNLAVNSRDAMPRGGQLTVETANVELDETYAREHGGVTPGPFVMLSVSDTGTGMNEETRSHLFEPFFTTKEPGKGTGLGLATVYGMVKQSGGNVWVYSEPGRGTTFKIYLPRVDEPVTSPELTPWVQPAGGGRETVLLAEDDPAVLDVACAALTQRGYRVLRASDGQTALQMARAESGEVHLLIADMVMPGMTGQDLAAALAVERPEVGVIFMSGYGDDAVVRHGVLNMGTPYLQKPFTGNVLAAKVRSVLDQRRSP